MRYRDGCSDLKSEVELVRDPERRMPEPVKGAREQLAAGYTTLDQASKDPWGSKERKGLSRDANHPRRY